MNHPSRYVSRLEHSRLHVKFLQTHEFVKRLKNGQAVWRRVVSPRERIAITKAVGERRRRGVGRPFRKE